MQPWNVWWLFKMIYLVTLNMANESPKCFNLKISNEFPNEINLTILTVFFSISSLINLKINFWFMYGKISKFWSFEAVSFEHRISKLRSLKIVLPLILMYFDTIRYRGQIKGCTYIYIYIVTVSGNIVTSLYCLYNVIDFNVYWARNRSSMKKLVLKRKFLMSFGQNNFSSFVGNVHTRSYHDFCIYM